MKHPVFPRFKNSLLALVFLTVAGTSQAAQENTDPQERVYQLRPSEKSEMAISSIGATGISARIHRGLVIKVESVMPDSPAEGKFTEGEILTGVNGVELEGKNPFFVFGDALTRAESNRPTAN